MGMFDHVDTPTMRCPGCEGDLGFQTKAAGNALQHLTVREVMEATRGRTDRGDKQMQMLGGCESCGWFVTVTVADGNKPFDVDAALAKRLRQRPERRRVEEQ